MNNKLILLTAIVGLNFLIVSCCTEKIYTIDEHHLTYRVPTNSKLYIDVAEIAKIKRGKKTFILQANETYLSDTITLYLKKKWTLQGNTGHEKMIKETSLSTSAIKIKNNDRIAIKNFHLSMEEYDSAEEKSLIEIDNAKEYNGKIAIKNMKLSNHYAGIWVKRGRNIDIDRCIIFDNGHQINLGFLQDKLNIHNYKVSRVNITNSEIRDSKKSGDINGIKTLSNFTKIKIINNLIEANEQDGIDLFPGGLDVLIKDNIIRDNRVHGIEVKMTEQYTPQQTGQIKRVKIKNNTIINNLHDGIACLDGAANYYAKGISILDNQIEASGKYGIRSELTVKIEGNTLKNNGLTPNFKEPKKPIGFTGIYLLNLRPDSRSTIKNNTIIDQAPISGIHKVYWLNLQNVHSFTEIVENKFMISTPTFDKKPSNIGIRIKSPPYAFDEKQVRQRNTFSKGFTEKVQVLPWCASACRKTAL